MKRVQSIRTTDGVVIRTHVAITARTGTHCPYTGWWTVDHPDMAAVVYLWKGDLMPGHSGNAAEWQLDKSDPGGGLLADMDDRAQRVSLLYKTGTPG